MGVELIQAWQALPDEQIASIGALDMMSEGMLRLIYVVAPEGSFVAVKNVFVGDRAFPRLDTSIALTRGHPACRSACPPDD